MLVHNISPCWCTKPAVPISLQHSSDKACEPVALEAQPVLVRSHAALHAQGTRLHQLCDATRSSFLAARHDPLASSSQLLYAVAKSAN